MTDSFKRYIASLVDGVMSIEGTLSFMEKLTLGELGNGISELNTLKHQQPWLKQPSEHISQLKQENESITQKLAELQKNLLEIKFRDCSADTVPECMQKTYLVSKLMELAEIEIKSLESRKIIIEKMIYDDRHYRVVEEFLPALTGMWKEEKKKRPGHK